MSAGCSVQSNPLRDRSKEGIRKKAVKKATIIAIKMA
jgi:hypothetical protein